MLAELSLVAIGFQINRKFQEAAILKETDVYKKMLKQADLCQAKTDAKKVKHANIK